MIYMFYIVPHRIDEHKRLIFPYWIDGCIYILPGIYFNSPGSTIYIYGVMTCRLESLKLLR